jgi:two-component system, response regulator RegA
MDTFQTKCLPSASQLGTKSVLIIEDDKRLRQCLARTMEARGFKVMTADSVFNGLAQIRLMAPEYAVVDLRLADGCGLEVIFELKQRRPDARPIILTGYGNIATAVQAVKFGAVDYLTKPVDVDDIVSALLAPKGAKAEPPQHRCRQLACAGNISKTFMKCAGATCQRRRVASTYIGAHYNGF